MSAFEECEVNLVYEDTSVSHLWWNDFAAWFVGIISNYVSPDVMIEMGDFLFGKTPFTVVAHDVLIEQPSFIIFFWLGILISVVSLAGAIVFLFPCARNWSTKKVSSNCMGITGVALSVVSLVFIVAGTAMYITADLNQIIIGQQQKIDGVKKNINTFMTTRDQNACFAQYTFDPIVNETNSLPDQVNAAFELETGLQEMAQVNFPALSLVLSQNASDVDEILASLQDPDLLADLANNAAALEQVNAAIGNFTEIQTALTTLPTEIEAYGQKVIAYQYYMADIITKKSKTTVHTASNNIALVKYGVNNATEKVASAMETTSSKIMHAASQIDFALNGAYDVIGSGWMVPRWLLWVPLIFAPLVALVAVGFGIFFSCEQSQAPNKGISCALTVLGIVMLALTCVVMIPAIVGMTFGYSTQTSFDPFFFDYNLKGLQSMGHRLPNFTIPSMKGLPVKSTFGEVMVTCKHENIPFFVAAVSKDSEVIDVTAFDKAINVTTLSKQFEDDIDIFPIKTIDGKQQASIYEALLLITSNLDMSEAKAFDAIGPIIDEMNAWKESLQPYVDDWLTAYDADPKYHFTSLTNDTDIKMILGQEMNDALTNLHNSMMNAGPALHQNLYEDGESCSNLYRPYGDAGDMATKGAAGPVQGMWVAAGLASLFFAPLGLALIFLSNAFRNGKGHFSPVHTVLHSPKAPTPAASPTHHQQVEAVASGNAAAPIRVEAAPIAPLHSASSDPWESDYMRSQLYAPQQSVQQFVDPLAYAAPRRVASPTTPYYPNPGSSSRH